MSEPVIDRLEAARICAHFFANGDRQLAEILTDMFVYPPSSKPEAEIARKYGISTSTLNYKVRRFKSRLGRAFITAGLVPESYANAQDE